MMRCIALSTRNQSNARTANIVIVMPMTMTGRIYIERREPACRVCTCDRPVSRRHPLYESNSTCVPVQSRYRGAISLDDHTASTIFCLPCDVIDYRAAENASRFNCLDCRGGNDFHLSYRAAD